MGHLMGPHNLSTQENSFHYKIPKTCEGNLIGQGSNICGMLTPAPVRKATDRSPDDKNFASPSISRDSKCLGRRPASLVENIPAQPASSRAAGRPCLAHERKCVSAPCWLCRGQNAMETHSFAMQVQLRHPLRCLARRQGLEHSTSEYQPGFLWGADAVRGMETPLRVRSRVERVLKGD